MERLVSLLGLLVMLGLAWAMSADRRRINLRLIFVGVALQFGIAVVILQTTPGRFVFEKLGELFAMLLEFVAAGSGFVFGVHAQPTDPELPPSFVLLRSFAFGVLPTIIFFSSLMALLYHAGVMQAVVRGLAWCMQKTLGTSGAESLSAAANVFVGQTEAPLVIGPYVPSMTQSELMAVMVGGFATISGGLLAAYHSFGISAGHLITASVISAPASLVIAKMLQPEVDVPQTLGTVKVDVPRVGVNAIDAAASGAADGLKLALNVGAMLIAFLALIAMADRLIAETGLLLGNDNWSLTGILGTLFSPVAWVMGIPQSDCRIAGELLGLKMVANEFIAYQQLGDIMRAGAEEGISERSELILTYALSGFSNFGAIGIQIGGIGGLAPDRRSDLARLGLRAMLGGTIACCMTACVAGVLI